MVNQVCGPASGSERSPAGKLPEQQGTTAPAASGCSELTRRKRMIPGYPESCQLDAPQVSDGKEHLKTLVKELFESVF
jgi:hypothetical protein